MANELKTCPFCGGKANLVLTGHNADGDLYTARCNGCGIGLGWRCPLDEVTG